MQGLPRPGNDSNRESSAKNSTSSDLFNSNNIDYDSYRNFDKRLALFRKKNLNRFFFAHL